MDNRTDDGGQGMPARPSCWILPVDLAVARLAAGLQVPATRPDRDCWIAATALVHGLTVVTRNTVDFAPMGAKLVNPWMG